MKIVTALYIIKKGEVTCVMDLISKGFKLRVQSLNTLM